MLLPIVNLIYYKKQNISVFKTLFLSYFLYFLLCMALQLDIYIAILMMLSSLFMVLSKRNKNQLLATFFHLNIPVVALSIFYGHFLVELLPSTQNFISIFVILSSLILCIILVKSLKDAKIFISGYLYNGDLIIRNTALILFIESVPVENLASDRIFLQFFTLFLLLPQILNLRINTDVAFGREGDYLIRLNKTIISNLMVSLIGLLATIFSFYFFENSFSVEVIFAYFIIAANNAVGPINLFLRYHDREKEIILSNSILIIFLLLSSLQLTEASVMLIILIFLSILRTIFLQLLKKRVTNV